MSPAPFVLVRFPFTDLSVTKKRPAVVVSPQHYTNRYGDVVLIPLTSVDQEDDSLQLLRWKVAGLMKATWVKPLVATVVNSLIERELGQLHKDDKTCICAIFRQIFDDFVLEI